MKSNGQKQLESEVQKGKQTVMLLIKEYINVVDKQPMEELSSITIIILLGSIISPL